MKEKWDPKVEQNPMTVGNNKSRSGFSFHPVLHPLGRFFQETIKKGIIATVRRIHDKEIPRYDKMAYTYDDPRLQFLDRIIAQAVERSICDTDAARKKEILLMCRDICLFMLKEDVFYRPRILDILIEVSEEIVKNREMLSKKTVMEQYNVDRFGIPGGGQHAHDFSDLPEDHPLRIKWKGFVKDIKR